MGVVAGVADMEYCKGGTTVFIEFKRPGESQSLKQIAFEALVKAEGFQYEVVTSFDQFKDFITGLQIQAETQPKTTFRLQNMNL